MSAAGTPPPTPEEDVAQARRALAAGDLPHAAHHVGCALAADPHRAEWLALLEEIVARADLPLSLAPIHDEAYFADVALRAWILGRQNDVAEGLGLLFQIATVRPDVPYLEWGAAWMRRDDVTRALRLEPIREAMIEHVAPPATELLGELPGPLAADDPARRTAAAAETILAILTACDARLAFVHAAFLRRLGRFDDALAVAQAGAANAPGWQNAVAVASAYRDLDDVDAAVRAFDEASALDPDDVTCHLDVGDMLLAHDRPAEAAMRFRVVLGKEPAHSWALPAYHFARLRTTGDGADRDRLIAASRALPEDEHADFLVDEALGEVPYVNAFPWPGDASARAAHRLEESPPSPGATVKLAVSHLEPPSVITALGLIAPGSPVEITVEAVQSPDPRAPRGAIEPGLLLWRYDGVRPIAALAPPRDDHAIEAVATLASTDYRAFAWMAGARTLADALGVERLRDLFAIMLHPVSPAEERIPAVIWVRLVQVAAALIVANLEPDAPWERSLRRRALLALARGPVDWTTDAAIVALAQCALADPAAVDEVKREFAALDAAIPEESGACYELALLASWSILPGLSDREHAALIARIDDLRVDGAAQDEGDDGEGDDDA